MIGATSVLFINNGAIVWLSGTHSASAITLGAFAGVMTLSQVPTQLSSAVGSPALSHLAHALEVGNVKEFNRLHRRIVLASSWFGALCIALFVVLGQEILSIYLGSQFMLPRADMALLAIASSLMLLTMVEQAVLGARREWGAVGKVWSVSAAVFVVTLFLPLGTLARAVIAPGVSVAFALVGMLIFEIRAPHSSGA